MMVYICITGSHEYSGNETSNFFTKIQKYQKMLDRTYDQEKKKKEDLCLKSFLYSLSIAEQG